MTTRTPLRIGSRASALALVQARILHDTLAGLGVASEIVTITTDGDIRAADTAWGEGAFVTAIEGALVGRRIDIAIHSAKDVPTDTDPRLAIAAYLPREEPRDALVLAARSRSAGTGTDAGTGAGLDRLAVGARVGTDSPRRSAFLLARRPDLRVHPIHGNVDTRLRRLDEGETDALVLAAAGLNRLGLPDRIDALLDSAIVPPAPGQGALAVQVRTDDAPVRDLVARLDDRPTRLAVELERAILAESGGGCRAPLGASATIDGAFLTVTAGYARAGGDLVVTAVRRVPVASGRSSAASVVNELAGQATIAARAEGAPPILVTRAIDRSAATSLALVDRRLAPWLVPCIAIEPAPSDELDVELRGLEAGDTTEWVVLTSVNAVDALREAADRLGVDLVATGAAGVRWAAIGRGTSNALRDVGIEVDFRPRHASGAALGATLPVEPGTRILVPRGDLADDILPASLRTRGAVVRSIVTYRTVEAPAGSIPLLEAALAAMPAAVVATSGSTIRGLATLAEQIGANELVRTIPVIPIGPATAAESIRLGFTVVGEPATQDPAGIADAVATAVLAGVAA
ncbi:MAG TPA: hydroxymethylbilane synthase [Candidatus Limnocylindrales bacterium]|nr:hydroxymethylbilane synthase [Candidatus Limnocylindrales bacterium]